MKSKKQIEAELEIYEGIETFNYEGPRPLSEYSQQRDIGYRDCLKWVLELVKE